MDGTTRAWIVWESVKERRLQCQELKVSLPVPIHKDVTFIEAVVAAHNFPRNYADIAELSGSIQHSKRQETDNVPLVTGSFRVWDRSASGPDSSRAGVVCNNRDP